MSSPPPEPTAEDDLFSSTSLPSYSQILNQLRRSNLTPHNRLTSIHADAAFVARVASAFGGSSNRRPRSHSPSDGDEQQGRRKSRRPLVANERCGSWYIPPERKQGSAYFKSTDGHERAWKFSTRRLNFHLVEMIEENDGIIIVDSTRRGKRMPDALSTTIPIWCTVLNLAVLPSNPLSSNLFLPPYLAASTHAQIVALIPSFLASLKELNLDLPTCLTKPLRPLWITQESALPEAPEPDDDEDEVEDDAVIFEDYRPIICCTASRRVIGGSEVDQGGYIQGAGDDTENWAMGLTPDVFWANIDALLSASEADTADLITTLVEEHKAEQEAAAAGRSATSKKRLTERISVCPLPLDAEQEANECIILLSPGASPKETWRKSPTLLEVGIGKSKTASRNLRSSLPEICSFTARFLQENASTGQIVVSCESGKDISIGVALALSCYLFDDDNQFRVPDANTSFTKTLVKAKLGSIMTVYPEANPSRATLQSVNSFLMDWRE